MIVEIDGNDGTGKTTIIKELKKHNPDFEIKDRGALSIATDSGKFKKEKNVCYVIITASPVTCQNRIKGRGDSIIEKYHTMEDLNKYHGRFINLGKEYNIPIYDTEGIAVGSEKFNELIKTIILYIKNEQNNFRNLQ